MFFVYCASAHQDLHVLTHSFPTRRSSDLAGGCNRVCRYRHSISGASGGHLKSPIRTTLRYPHSSSARYASCTRRERAPSDRCTTATRPEEHTSELQSLMRTQYAVSCLKKKNQATH